VNREEFFDFMAREAKIEIDRNTGFAHIPVVNFGRDEKGAIEAAELVSLVNATIQLCQQSIMQNVGPDLNSSQIETMRATFGVLKVK
jgi:hypothetical protein